MRRSLHVVSAAAVVLLTATLAVPRALPAQSKNRPELTTTVESRAEQPGEVFLFTVTSPRDISDVHVHVFDRDIAGFQVGERTWRVLVGVDLETAPKTYSAAVTAYFHSGVPSVGTVPLRVLPKQFRTRKLTVDEAFVNPPPEAMERIARETAELNDLWAHSASTRLWSGPFVRPVPDPANSAFGTRSILNGQPRSPHSGADFNSATGTPIKSPNAGRVVLAGDRYYTGNTVMIDHGLALFSLFAHLSEIQVKVGDTIAAGDVIGKVGATGRVTGPHLHWSVRLNGARVDPLSLLAVMGDASAHQ
jgi:murein DD-endopeptidase MepM/ murein hydrolase activator NlpD